MDTDDLGLRHPPMDAETPALFGSPPQERDPDMSRLVSLLYEELREVAHRQLRNERAGHTLQTTGLVHEAFIKLVALERVRVTDRGHFFALAARLMRQILLDYAKSRRSQKRGGGAVVVSLDDSVDDTGDGVSDREVADLIDLDAALTRLGSVSERQARVVEYRFFAGLDEQETAELLGVSKATVKRDWRVARAWLNRALV